MAQTDFDILIAGGGVAGLTAARLLAGDGWRVALAGQPRPAAWEGISPRVVEGLRRAGCAAAEAACATVVPRSAAWNGERHAANVECLVERAVFDAALWQDAAVAGATLIDGRVTAVERDGTGWRLSVGDRVLTGGFLVEARGRKAPKAGPHRWSGPHTVALAQAFDGPPPARAESGVTSCPDGWIWFAVLPDGRRLVQVFADAADVPARDGLAAFHAERMTQAPDVLAWLDGARPVGEVTARDATPLITAEADAPGGLRIGDAAFGIDPLSGHGTYEAIGGALIARPVIATLLDCGGDSAAALQFHRERVVDAFHRHALAGRAFYGQETRWTDRPFWRDRATWDPAALPAPPPAPARAEVAVRPVIEGNRVVARRVVVTPQHRRGILSIDDVPLAPLLDALTGDATPAVAAARLDRSPAQIAKATAWLVRQGLLPAPAAAAV